jgi:hypothetical protein
LEEKVKIRKRWGEDEEKENEKPEGEVEAAEIGGDGEDEKENEKPEGEVKQQRLEEKAKIRKRW